jgi:toxin ParE1/3/4
VAYRLSLSAETALEDIRIAGIREWGAAAADKYDLLLDTALAAISIDPRLYGSRQVPRLAGIRIYPIRFSRKRVPPDQRVGRPRHLIVYRVASDGVVEVLGIVHDRMLLGRATRRLLRRASFRAK